MDAAMNELDQHRKDISEIRSMMERSSKVLSLSGLSGVSAGIIALSGVMSARWVHTRVAPDDVITYITLDALFVLVLALGMAVLFSSRMARKQGVPVWTNTSKHLIIDLAIPLASGGIFSIALMVARAFALIPGTMLVFYGLSLFSGSKYAMNEIRYLGLTELALGSLALFMPQEGLNFWAIGFGVMHIVYGLWMYSRYER